MFTSGALRHAAPRLQRPLTATRRHLSHNAKQTPSNISWSIFGVAVAGSAVGYLSVELYHRGGFATPVYAEGANEINKLTGLLDELVVEGKRPKGASKEDNRDTISSQHVQVKRSWENPGVYAWGLNTGRVVAPDSDERWVKTPRRIPFFDGVLLRDIKLDKGFGAAINEKGDLLQWGVDYAPNTRTPEVTLAGKNLKSLAISDDRIIALSNNGSVYSIPVSKNSQATDPKLKESSWLWTSSSTKIACRSLTPRDLGIGEQIVTITGGLQHILMLTSRGRVYSAASSTKDFPSSGQLGIPGLSWYNRPSGPFDQPHEVKLLGGNVKQIAAGDAHSLALDKHGRVFSFGDNTYGQLGIQLNTINMDLDKPLNINSQIADTPVLVRLRALYPDAIHRPEVKSISAGGQNSYFVIETERDAALKAGPPQSKASTIISDTWACGRGIWGTLGTGKWTHVQWGPAKIPALSGLFEYDEKSGRPEPIRVGTVRAGQSHVAAVMSNITSVAAGAATADSDTNWGSDVYFFGNNENFQLGTGRRNNLNLPSHIQPLGISVRQKDGMSIDRFQLTPTKKITVAGRPVVVEQRVECGRQCTAVYSATP